MPKVKKAFTLAEVMVAITILGTSLAAITSLQAKNIKANSQNIERLKAYLNAKSTLELVRNQRDTLWLKNETPTKNKLEIEDRPAKLTIEEIQDPTPNFQITAEADIKNSKKKIKLETKLTDWQFAK